MPCSPISRRTVVLAALALAALPGLTPAGALAAILTVGAGGAFATLQAALTQAQSTAAADEIRVRDGSYPENLTVGSLTAGNDLDISGGWAAGFTVRNPTPGLTEVNAGGVGRALLFSGVTNTTVAVRGLAFRLGTGGPYGGGVNLTEAGASNVLFERCLFENNGPTSNDSVSGAAGGGLYVSASGSARFLLVDSIFNLNTAVMNSPNTGAARGAGVAILAAGSATAILRGVQFLENTLSGGAVNTGAGLHVEASSSATVRVEDTLFFGNHGNDGTDGAALTLVAMESSSIDARRLGMDENGIEADGSNQAGLWTFDGASLRLSDSLLTDSDQGIFASARAAAGSLRLVNLTVTGHSGLGIELGTLSGGIASISNSISFDNAGGDTSFSGGGLTLQSNLFAVDPVFVDPAAGDYSLAAGSPAHDAGTATPEGGLSPYDFAHAPRVAGPLPDQGALERDAIFGDGFESGDLGGWAPSS
ncbi:MAG: hypothetical protein U0X73_07610 [Thermoanaerobaculia bacterium]